MCADEWLSVFADCVGHLGNGQEAEHKELEQLPCKSDVAEETMSAMVKLANDPLEPCDIGQPTAEWRDERRPVQGRAEDTDEGVKTPHTEMCKRRSHFRGGRI